MKANCTLQFSILQVITLLKNTQGIFTLTSVRLKHRKRITANEKKWRDPNDMSWAEELFERQHQEKEKKSNVSSEKEPVMLHLVERIKKLAYRPYWERDVCKELGLAVEPHQVMIIDSEHWFPFHKL